LAHTLGPFENSRTDDDFRVVVRNLLKWLNLTEQDSLRRAFTVWFNRVLLPRKILDNDFTEFKSLEEVETMLSEAVKGWKKEGEILGAEKGRQEGRQQGRQEEAAKLFLLLLDSKFGVVSQELQAKIRQSSPEDIEKWTKQIFKAETPEALLNS